ncbi:LPS export ABC transporter periplasmic protein LptC [Gluconacetobacter takamatsuzukensis]|uniref:LPS export ABC transporter periplasmic protein LptC n=1 Tax=Gluconacetobacter takamatsuzukensis TaxID=1286190 RepID=A0A7W4KD27_9PROT|nr:LPS export ABC transporter periplasmic protein LptC [Gluconacetobacter takamatsuzukensis]MBB2204600.1 LPS export ABC transporter periplasmic protein LptC [Gluconacetobacter takamatsuzukensis]
MSLPPPPDGDTPPRREDFARSADQIARQRSLLHQDTSRLRRVLRPSDITRRRRLVRWAKWALPAAALLLLSSIAVWPAIDRLVNMQRGALREMENLRVSSGNMLGAVYRGLDDHDRPFMITADQAQQVGPDRINLARPAADTLTQGGDWMMVSAAQGVYLQREQLLDLTQDVSLYREDGVIMTGVTADMDLRQGIIASDQWVHAEGPFGVLDAQGVLLSQHEGIAQFRGPGRLVLNDDAHAGPASHPSTPQAAQTEPSR